MSEIVSKPATPEYEEAWERIFKKKNVVRCYSLASSNSFSPCYNGSIEVTQNNACCNEG